MAKAKSRIIIDTNLWISYLLTKRLAELDKLFADKTITLLYSEELITEFITVAQRPKFRKYFSTTDLQNLLQLINLRAEFVEVTSETDACRDAKDNFLLSLAADGKATHLITGDKDLLELNKFGKTKILTIADYLGKR